MTAKLLPAAKLCRKKTRSSFALFTQSFSSRGYSFAVSHRHFLFSRRFCVTGECESFFWCDATAFVGGWNVGCSLHNTTANARRTPEVR